MINRGIIIRIWFLFFSLFCLNKKKKCEKKSSSKCLKSVCVLVEKSEKIEWMNEWIECFVFIHILDIVVEIGKWLKHQFNSIQFDSIRFEHQVTTIIMIIRKIDMADDWYFENLIYHRFFSLLLLPLLVNYIWIRRKSFLVFFFFIFTFFARNISRKTKLSEVIMWSSLITYQLFNQTTTNRKKRS